MLGLHFENCNTFSLEMEFEKCILNLSSFYQLKLKATQFRDCSLQEVDFSQCDLTSATFDNCDLSLAIFDNTILEKADLRTAYHYQINPENNHIRKAKFGSTGLAGLLMQYDLDIYN